MSQKINIIDLFAGCGGLTEGFCETHLYNTLACVEWEYAPYINLQHRLKNKWNYQNVNEIVLRFDIQRSDELFNGWDDIDYGKSKGLDYLIKDREVHLIIGGPPCQAYSIAGRIQDANSMKDDYRNYLFERYLKVVERYKPDAFIFENVPGILSAKPNGIKVTELIQKAFSDIGYDVLLDLKDALINMGEYGIAQSRKRIIILALNKQKYDNSDQLLKTFYNDILPKYKESIKTVQDTIVDLPKLTPLKNTIVIDGKKYSHSIPDQNIENHIPRWHSKRDMNIFHTLTTDIENKNYKYITTDALKKLYTEKTGKSSNIHKYHVIQWDKPSNTIPAHIYKDGLRHIHPDSTQSRSITVREAARLQSFPDDYHFISTVSHQYKMIGNAVPPKFSNKLALALYDLLYKI